MNPEVKGLWLEALRSGETEQTTKVLGRPDGSRCCLGVLCDLAVQAKLIDSPVAQFDDEIDQEALFYAEMNTTTLPTPVSEWAWIVEQYLDGTQMYSDQNDPKVTFTQEWKDKWGVTVVGYVATLSQLNDGGASFEAIAELIEEQL